MREMRNRRDPDVALAGFRPTVPAMPRPRLLRPLLMLLILASAIGAAEPFSLERLAVAHQQSKTLRVTFTQEKHLAILKVDGIYQTPLLF